jgi:esterase/lipase superfamily enzyme
MVNLKSHFFLLVLVFTFTINCPKQPEISELLNQRIKNNYDETVLMNVYFSTLRKDRPLSSRGCSNGYFSTMLGTDLRFGKCIVNTPSEHTIGSLDSAQLGMPNKFFSMKEYSELDGQSITKVIQDSSEKEVIVFVHGFNVGFEEAIYRAAQIKYDMKFQGEMLVYTWPAGGEDESFINQLFMKGIYESNLMNAINSRAHFKTFLRTRAPTATRSPRIRGRSSSVPTTPRLTLASGSCTPSASGRPRPCRT